MRLFHRRTPSRVVSFFPKVELKVRLHWLILLRNQCCANVTNEAKVPDLDH